MLRKLSVFISLLLTVLILTGASMPDDGNTDDSTANIDVIEYDQQNTVVSEYMSEVTYSPNNYSYSRLSGYVRNTGYSKSRPFGAAINVPQAGTITLTDGGRSYSYEVDEGEHTIYNITPGTIGHYSVVNNSGVEIASGYLSPTGSLRMICGKSTRNIRDLGGWKCDGGTVKYGMLFRGGDVQAEDARMFHDLLGIRAELSLLWDSESNRDHSLIGDDVEFMHIGGPWYTIHSFYQWPDNALKNITEYVMDKAIAGCPLYIHCAAGADRTGTVAFILESLLGVSQSDTDKDYELTSFDTGIDNDDTARRRDEDSWKDYMKMFDAYEGDIMRDRVLSWALSKGISIRKINAFRAAMIDGEPVKLYNNADNSYMLGDTDDDEEVTVIDATVIQRYSAHIMTGIDNDLIMQGDVDSDGEVDVIDATLIQRFIAEYTVAYPIGEWV